MKYMILLTIAAASLIAADATGKWTGTLTTDEKPGPALLVLKQEGSIVTGTGGPDAGEQHAIQNGKAENGNITFELLSTGGRILKFVLRQEGDEIKGDVTRERDGQTQRARLAVKRDK